MPINCDAIKIAYRQSKDGFVVSFAIHPQDMPAVLANADIGSQWQLTLVELDEHGNAEQEVMPNQSFSHSGQGQNRNKTEPAPAQPHPTQQARAKQSWHDMSPAQQAGVLCTDKSFIKFLADEYQRGCDDENEAADIVRWYCDVESRAEIKRGTRANVLFQELAGKYRAWMREPEVVG